MKKLLFITLLVLCTTLGLYAQSVLSCYDIQYNPIGDGLSPYATQIVTVQGIVVGGRFYSGTGANNYGFFISDPEGGAWSGLFIYNQQHQPTEGDLVKVTGTVTEYYNFTEITSVSAYQLISQNNAVPEAALITTATLSNSSQAEQWESVLVKIQNASVVSAPSAYQEFSVTDGSGSCQIDNQFFTPGHTWQNIAVGVSFAEITGIVDYTYSLYGLNPRSLADMQSGSSNLTLTLPDVTVGLHSPLMVPLNAIGIDATDNYQSYQLTLNYNPNVLSYQSVDNSGTLSQTGTVNVSQNTGSLGISYSGNSTLSGQGVLIKLNFMANNTGVSVLNLSSVSFGADDIQSLINGSVTVNSNYNTIGDTLTVIQRPILNIPAIQIPGETLAITCVAPSTTTGFNAWLLHGSKRISMPVTSSNWQTTPDRWELQATVPQVPVFELYDLEINANGGIHDISQNAVQVLPSRKSSYYFVQITDLHMPTIIRYPDAGFDTDSTAVVDYRAVMEDINLIRPEFVLITGDLVDEGELENFSDQYWYGWVQRELSEMEVPVYVVAGNHDIGGWNSTPPPAGSSRRNWWRYFGWKWLDNASTSWPYHTQDYYFTYGNTAFIGLEAYNNYENWRSNIYGSDSFTSQQLAWLNNTVNAFPGYTKVLFHHYDFQTQLNLGALGIDMALWGHIHSNSGSIYSSPYDLGTKCTCNGGRAYRVIKVNNDQLTPLNTIYAGANGSNISVSYSPSNYAVADTVSAVIVNNQSMGFENSLIKFNMPLGNSSYTVTGGELEQIDRSGIFNVCYVRVNLLPSVSRTVTIKVSGVSNSDLIAVPSPIRITSCYPNPMVNSSEIEIMSDKTSHGSTLEVYNLKGQKVQDISLPNLVTGVNRIAFNPTTGLASGIYYLKISGSLDKPYRFVIVK
ncbi:MAG: metallophosphoesterase [Candidatus Cloacimonetes bacterium]|nr:metallophosphoesterase [Candidatus Cloacimonadota bacterium]